MNVQEDSSSSAGNSGHVQEAEPELYQWRICEWVSAVFSVLGWIVATVDYESRYSEVRDQHNCVQNHYTDTFRWIDVCLTGVALLFLVLRHVAKRQWNARKISVDSFQQPLARFWGRLGAEVAVLGLFPYPEVDGQLYVDEKHRETKWTIEFVRSDVCYTASELLYALMFLRFFFVLRALINMSPFMDGNSKRVCRHFDVKANMRFSMRALARTRPFSLFCVLALPTALLASMLVRLFERPYVLICSQDFPYYPNSVYYVYISMTTIAYGDFYSCTQLGRLVSILIGVWGMGIFSMMIYVMDAAISMSSSQLQAFQAIRRTREAALFIEALFVHVRDKQRRSYEALRLHGQRFRTQMHRIGELQALKGRRQKAVTARLGDLEQTLLRVEIRAGAVEDLENKLERVKCLCADFCHHSVRQGSP